jgi:hypothetical protein
MFITIALMNPPSSVGLVLSSQQWPKAVEAQSQDLREARLQE